MLTCTRQGPFWHLHSFLPFLSLPELLHRVTRLYDLEDYADEVSISIGRSRSEIADRKAGKGSFEDLNISWDSEQD